MLRGVRTSINNQLATQVSNERFTDRDGETYIIHPLDEFEVRSVDGRVIGYADNMVNLDLFDVPASSREVMDYWWELEHAGLPLNAVARELLLYQAEIHANFQMLPAFAPYTSYVELVGLMHQLDRDHAVDGFEAERNEIREQVTGKLNSDALYPDNNSAEEYLRRFNVGLPNLTQTASDFCSELRFGRELARVPLDVEFKETGGVDMIVESRHRVEVTRKRFNVPFTWIEEEDQQFLDMDIEERTTTIRSAATDAFDHAQSSIQAKIDDRDPDIVAVDVSSRMPGFELIAHRCLNDARIFDFEKNFEEAMEECQDGPVGFLFFHGRSIDPFISALPPIAWPE